LYETAVESELWSFGKGSERSQRIIFGKMLGRQRDRVIGDFRILSAGKLHRVTQWVLQLVGDLSERETASEDMPVARSDEDQEVLDIPIGEDDGDNKLDE